MAKVINTYEVNELLDSLTTAQSIIRTCLTKLETLGIAPENEDKQDSIKPENKKAMKLSDFRKEYGIPQTTVLQLIHSKDFPAYKIGSRWYVDVPKYLKWREQEHANSYKYA